MPAMATVETVGEDILRMVFVFQRGLLCSFCLGAKVCLTSICKFDGIRPSGFVRQIRPMRRCRFPSDGMTDYRMVLPNPIFVSEEEE